MEKKSIILVLLILLMVYWVLGVMVKDLNGSGGSVVCKFMEEYLQDNENKGISPEITDEGIRNSLLKASDDLMRITESTYACHCDSAADFMKDGVSLKDMYADKCDNKCNILNRPLTKCNSDEECDFPMGCFKYDRSLESFQSYAESGSTGSGVCVMDTSIHHLSDLISVYTNADAANADATNADATSVSYTSLGSELETYLESDEANPFCYQPVTELVKVTDYNENGYVKSNTQDGNDCCLIKDFPDEDQTSIAMAGAFLDSEDGQTIIRQAIFVIVSNLAIMSARLVLAYSGTSTAGLMGRTLVTAADGTSTVSLLHELKEGEQLVSKTGETVDFLTMARSLEYGKIDVISRALRWVFFGGRQAESTALLGSRVGNFPGVFGILKSLKTAASGSRGAQKLGQVALADMTEAGEAGAAAASRAAAEELGELGGERVAETGGVAVAESLGGRGAARVVGGLGARAVLAPLKFLLTGPVGAALAALQLAGAVMDNYDMGGYQNILDNKASLKMFDAYTGPFIEGMKAITGREPPYGIDLVKTFFRGDDLVWPYHRCQDATTSGWECSLENIKNKKDKDAAKALIIIVRALKQAELDEMHSKMKTQLNEMGKSLKDQGTYIDFLTGLDGSMNDNPADPTSGAANFLQEYLLDTLTLSYTGDEAQLRDKRYAQNITAAIRAPVPDGFGPTDGDKYLGWLEGDATDVIKDYSQLSVAKRTRLADNLTPSPNLPSVESAPRGVTQDALVYFNSKLSPLYGGIQLTKRGVKLYNRYRNLRKDQEYIAFSKQYMAIAAKHAEAGSSGYTYQLQKLNCHDIFEIGDNDYPGFAQMTQLNKLDPICRYGTKWGKEGDAVDIENWGTDSMDLEHSWVKMKNGVTDPSDQPFGVSDTDPCPWGSGCYEATASVRNGTYPWSQSACKSTGTTANPACEAVPNPSLQTCYAGGGRSCNFVAGHNEDNMTNSSNNYKNRIMAFNYNIYMRESVNARDIDIYNDQDPVLDYSHWASFEESSAHASTWAIDDYKEWRSTAPVAFLLDPNDAIDDDNYTCNITANRVTSAASANTISYCGRMAGSGSTFNRGVPTPPSQRGPLKWGGLGTLGVGQNGTWDIHDPVARYGQGPQGVGRERQYNECIISRTHEAFEFVFGTAITNNIERLFDWF